MNATVLCLVANLSRLNNYLIYEKSYIILIKNSKILTLII